MAEWWRPWVTPVVVVAAAGIMLTYMETRFSSFDRRFDTLAAEMSGQRDRTDRVIESIGEVRADVAAVRSELASVRRRVDRIGDHLEVTEVPDGAVPTVATVEDAIRILQGAGMEFYDASGRATDESTLQAVERGELEGRGFIVEPGSELQQQLDDLGVEVTPLTPNGIHLRDQQ